MAEPNGKQPPTHPAHLQDRLSAAFDIPPSSRASIYKSIFADSDIRKPYYWVCLLSSCGIATLGLAQNSPAVIIGAMLLSPLMGPILGLGLALAIGDLYLGIKSAANCLISTILVVGLSALITVLIPFREVTAEIAARTQPNPLDLFIALFCGIIAAVSAARAPSSGAGTALPGVAIAVAIVPPLCVAGWGLGAGLRWSVFRGGLVLYLTNLTAILLTSMVFFLLVRVGAPENTGALRAFIAERERGKPFYAWLESHPWAARFRRIGTVGNRMLAVALVVAFLFIPLYAGLRQVKWQLLVKSEVTKAIAARFAEGTVLNRKITVRPDGADVNLVLVAGRSSSEASVRELENHLRSRLGPEIRISFTEVASGVLEREWWAARAVPSARPLKESIAGIQSRDYGALKSLWPGEGAGELVDLAWIIPLGSSPAVLRVRYLSDTELPPAALDAFRRGASLATAVKQLPVRAERLPRTWGELDLARAGDSRHLAFWKQSLKELGFPPIAGLSLHAQILLPIGASASEVARSAETAKALLHEASQEAPCAGWSSPTEPEVREEENVSKPRLRLVVRPAGPSPSAVIRER